MLAAYLGTVVIQINLQVYKLILTSHPNPHTEIVGHAQLLGLANPQVEIVSQGSISVQIVEFPFSLHSAR